MARVAIAGGGIAGLSAAYYLSRAGHECTLIEPQPRLGGVIRTECVDGCLVESGPDSFISQKPWALQLIKELGIGGDVIPSNDHLRKTYILRHGKMTAMPEGLFLMVPTAVRPLAFSGLVSFDTKLKMAAELLRRPNGRKLQDRPVAEFIREHYGQETVDYLTEPLLAGIYGGDPAELSIRSVLPRFVEFEEKYGSVTRGVLANRPKKQASSSIFQSLKGGMQQLVTTLESAIAERVKIVRDTVREIGVGSGYRVHCEKSTIEAEHVVVATPAYTAGTLLRGLDPALADLLGGVRYHSSMAVALIYDSAKVRQPLPGFGFLVPRVERRRITAGTWVGTKFPNRVPENRTLLRCFIGVGADEEQLGISDEALTKEVLEEVRRLLGITEQPLHVKVDRSRRAMAQYTVGHEQRMQEVRGRLARLRGIHLAGNAYLGIGVPDCIHTALDVAGEIP